MAEGKQLRSLIAEDDFVCRKYLHRLEEKQVKIIMTTALTEGRNVTKAFGLGCVAYAGKPINRDKFD